MKKYDFYISTKNYSGRFDLEVDETEIINLQEKKSKLLKVLELLDIYEQLIDSHIESKSLFYKLSVKSAIERDGDDAFIRQVRNDLNRCMFNTLNLGKLYLDKHFFANKSLIYKVSADESKHKKVEDLRQQVFNKNTEYMTGCELRAYSQHASIMTRTIHTTSRRDPATSQLTHNIKASITKGELSSQIKISKDKIERISCKIDLQSCLDGYVDGISEMHILNIELLQETVDDIIRELNDFAELASTQADIDVTDGYILEVIGEQCPDGANSEKSGLISFTVNSEWNSIIASHLKKRQFRTKFLHTKHDPN